MLPYWFFLLKTLLCYSLTVKGEEKNKKQERKWERDKEKEKEKGEGKEKEGRKRGHFEYRTKGDPARLPGLALLTVLRGLQGLSKENMSLTAVSVFSRNVQKAEKAVLVPSLCWWAVTHEVIERCSCVPMLFLKHKFCFSRSKSDSHEPRLREQHMKTQ